MEGKSILFGGRPMFPNNKVETSKCKKFKKHKYYVHEIIPILSTSIKIAC